MNAAALTSVPDLAPAGPEQRQRGIRVPQLLASLLVIALFALLAVWWQARSTARVPALALANDVEVGVPIERGDLTEIYISTDVPAVFEDPQFADLFVGVVPIANLTAGTILTDDMFRTASELGPNQAMVGVRVTADEAPPGLVPGDRVQVLVGESGGGAQVLAGDAQVESVSISRDGGAAVLKLRMGVEDAQAVQVVADRVVLIEVDPAGLASWESGGPEGSEGAEGGG